MKLFESIINQTATPGQAILLLLVSVAIGVVFGLVYCLLKQKDGYFKDVPITLAVFPFIVCELTLAISALTYAYTGDIATVRFGRLSVALVTAFAMLKFRSQQRTTEDLTYLFGITGAALIIGMGYLWFGLLIFGILTVLIIALYKLGYPLLSKRNLNLKVTIPEDLNYEHVFDDIFKKYTKYNHLTKVKTSDMGTMFVLNFEIILKPDVSTKEFIDEIRERNGNLNVVLTVKKYTTIE